MNLDSKSGPWYARAFRQALLMGGDALGLNALNRRRTRSNVRVLNYHGVLDVPLPATIWTQLDADVFRRQMRYLKKCYRVVRASEVDWSDPSVDDRVVVTFDDGLANNLLVAAPILEELGLVATCFVSTGLIDEEPGTLTWPDLVYEIFLNPAVAEVDMTPWGLRRIAFGETPASRAAELVVAREHMKALPDDRRRDLVDTLAAKHPLRVPAAESPLRMMTRDELARLAESPAFEIALHSHTHPIMSKLDAEGQEREVAEGIRSLYGWGIPWKPIFAYPNGKPGDYDERTVAALERHHIDVAMTTDNAHYDPRSGDPMHIQRLMIGDDVTWWELKATLSGYHYRLQGAIRAIRKLL